MIGFYLLRFLMLYVGVLPLYAQSNLLSEGPGAAAAAMGRTATALAADPTALYWNPAGLTDAGGAVTGEHMFLFDGARYDFAGLTVPSRFGSFGFGALQLYRGNIVARSAVDDPGSQVSASQADYMAGYAKGFGAHWSAGSTLNVLDYDLAGYRDRGFGLDAGAKYQAAAGDLGVLRRPYWTAGATIKNLLEPSLRLDRVSESFPRDVRAALTLGFDGFSRLSTATGDIHMDRATIGLGVERVLGAGSMRFGAGLSYTIQDILTLRLGVDDGFAVGVGFKTSDDRFSVDYTLEDRPLSKNNRFTLTYRFLNPRRAARRPAAMIADNEYAHAKARAEELGREDLAEADAALRDGDYAKAVSLSQLAVLLMPDDGRARTQARRDAEAQRLAQVKADRDSLNSAASNRNAEGSYLALTRLLAEGTDDRGRLAAQATEVARHLTPEQAVAVSTTVIAEGEGRAGEAMSRGLDEQAITVSQWMVGVAVSSTAVVQARSFEVLVATSTAAHRKTLQATVARLTASRSTGRALLAALAFARAYPSDPQATAEVSALRRAYESRPEASLTDRLYVRRLYYLAAAAWASGATSAANTYLDELRRRDAGDEAAAALTDAMVRAGAIYETFS
ncbi:MAG: hypothetical protein KGM24_11855 [Elusimicrobia bacterium]|nr:hypothetical protein [Elusimicrobiota bacterium]